VNNSGKRETCPATARGLNAPRYLRSLSASRLLKVEISAYSIRVIAKINVPEWYQNQQYRLLVDVPAEQERGIATQGDCADEVVPRGAKPQLCQAELRDGQSQQEYGKGYETYDLEDQRQEERRPRLDVREHCKCSVPDKASGDAIDGSLVDFQSKSRGHYGRQ